MKVKIGMILTLSVFIAALSAQAAGTEPWGAAAAKADREWSVEEMLRYAIEDEYLARAEYEAIMDRYGSIRPFSRIIESEETHIELLAEAYRDAGISLPKDESASHVVLPPTLRDAYETGVRAEIENISMYDSFLKSELLRKPENQDLADLFERLRDASKNHLEAFRRGLSR